MEQGTTIPFSDDLYNWIEDLFNELNLSKVYSIYSVELVMNSNYVRFHLSESDLHIYWIDSVGVSSKQITYDSEEELKEHIRNIKYKLVCSQLIPVQN